MSFRVSGDRGETLVETLIAVVILGVVGAAIIGGMLMSVKASDYHRREATAESLVRAAAESVKGATYAACPATIGTAGSYPLTQPTGYTSTVTNIEYWTGTSSNTFQSSCVSGADQGLERVTIQVAATNGRDTETLALLKRKQ